MTKGQWKDLLREILRNKSRFLSILFIVSLGVAFLSGIRASEPDMLISVDEYYDAQEFMDIRVIGTLGLTDDDVADISKIKGVSYAAGGKYTETYVHFTDNTGDEPRLETKALKVYEYLSGINEPYIIEGNVPYKTDEMLIDSHLARYYDLKLGDQITLISGSDAPLSDTLTQETYTICGIGISPWYLHHERGTGNIGTGTIDYFVMVNGAVFVADYYTEIYVQVDGAQELLSGTDTYDEVVDRVVDRIKLLEDAGAKRRLAQVREQAIDEALESDDYRDAYSEAYDEALADAKKEAYDEAYEKVLNEAYDEALATAMETARAEALKTVKAEALEEAIETARAEALETAIKTAHDQAYETALEQVLEEGYETALETAKKTAYDQALATTRQTAYDEGYAQITSYVDSIAGQIVDALAGLNEEQLNSLKEALNNPTTTLSEQLDKVNFIFKSLGINMPDNIDVNALMETQIYSMMVDALKKYVENNEVTEQDKTDAKATLIADVTPSVKAMYEEYFNSQFDTVYKTLFDLQFEAQFEKLYGETVRQEFEKTFNEQYKATFDAEFEKTFNEQYLGMVKEQFDATFDTQYLPIIELSFDKTFEEEYLEQFNEEFEKTFMEDYLGEFEEEFYKTFEEEGKPQFDEEFYKTFEEDYQELFDEEFDKKFNEEFVAEAGREIDEKLELPKWYVLNRTASVPSYVEYIQDAEGIGKIGTVFPIIFFLVAALVALTTMTRMVDDERIQIGSMKAMGYSNMSIAGKYIIYTLASSVTGSIIGVLIGEKLFPLVIINAYGILFIDVPNTSAPYQIDIAAYSSIAAIGCVLLATVFACFKSTREKPAGLMRPPAPKAGSRILLERITFIWNHLSFTAKASMRNLFRYKKRLFMTIFGIAGCMALMMVGYGLKDSIMTITDTQYKEIFLYDSSVTMSADAKEEETEALMQSINGYEGVRKTLEFAHETMDVSVGDYSRSVELYVPESVENISDFMVLRDRNTQEKFEYPATGVALSEKTAKQLGVTVGDSVTFMSDDKEYTCTVSCVFENYVYHFAFVSHETYVDMFEEEPVYNTVFMLNDTRDEAFQDKLSTFIMSHDAAGGVVFISTLNGTLGNMLTSLNGVIWVLIISAGLLAFVVLYNLNNISIAERRRELATIKVLGFFHTEVAAYIYRDNIWLTLFGCVAGVFLGRYLHAFIIDTVEVDMLMFGRNISLESYIMCILFTVLFSVIVNFIMYFQLKKIDMVESLKSVE